MSEHEHITIAPNNSEAKSQNYSFLRETGINYLQKVAGKIWTDYNVHDPGVTILEELSYAISDLARKANLDIKDIIAINEAEDSVSDSDGEFYNKHNNFHTAREILTNSPFTQNDYRRLLIDTEFVKNAWLEKTTDTEIDFYHNVNEKEISFEQKNPSSKIELNGLYEVLLEFDEHEDFEDLNDNTLNYKLPFSDIEELKPLLIAVCVEFQYWSYQWEDGKGWSNLEDIYESIRSIKLSIDQSVAGLQIEVFVSQANEISVNVLDVTESSVTSVEPLKEVILERLNSLFDITGNSEINLLLRQQKKVETTHAIVDSVKEKLHAHRNLCEDFVRFSALKVEEIIMCADIELEADAQTEEVLADIYLQIAAFLSPEVNMYSFSEMLEKGYSTVDIFEGPKLENGFIDPDDLERSSRMHNVHVSDLINIIMDIKGVVAIRNMEIANIPLGDSSILSKNAKWCLSLAWEKNFVPRLNSEQSKIKFIKKGIPFIANQAVVDEIIAAKKADRLIERKNQTKEEDLPIPNGDFYHLEDYTSIHFDFPENYGIGSVGLPKSASSERKAQASQLKAFLLFFDQFLANYCSQLANVRRLFSMNEDVDRTYFTQTVYDVPGNELLFQQFVDFVKLSDDPDKDSNDILEKWEMYKVSEKEYQQAENELSKNENRETNSISYLDKMNEIIESKEGFYERRNLFLDHLLARFCEQFTDYAMLVYRIEGKKSQQELIDDKETFLAEYPQISYNRGKAFNYKEVGWNSTNVSGLEHRVSRILGIDNYSRRDLACNDVKNQFFKFNKEGKRGFRIKSLDNEVLLTSELFEGNDERNDWIQWVLDNGIDTRFYRYEDDDLFFSLVDETDRLIGTSPEFESVELRDSALLLLISMLKGDCSGEGFYLLEHVLLRPRTDSDILLPVSFQDDCYCAGNEDAYSFRATCVMPYWIGRFDNMDFRHFVERTLREETPAHVFLKICWINKSQMSQFQSAYKEWLTAMKNKSNDPNALTQKQNALVAILNDLRNVYPASYLYDCKESERAPIALGQSILGTFIPEENE